MEKKNIQISSHFEREGVCASNTFGYYCDNTPNNCTECPVMRFLYHDLITNILSDESATQLTGLVNGCQLFSGKYDGATELPEEVWTAIHAIRHAFDVF